MNSLDGDFERILKYVWRKYRAFVILINTLMCILGSDS